MSVRLTMSDLVKSSESARSSGSSEQQRQHDYQPRPTPNGELELGWDGVASGLTRILIGYSLMFLQLFLLAALIWYIISSLPTAALANNPQDLATTTLIVTAGLGAIGLCALFSCIMIFTGKCRCAVNSPELGGARWLIFCCILCLAGGTLLGLATSILGPSSAKGFSEAKTQAELFMKLQPPSIQEIAAASLNLTASILFVLFLRAIGQRFDSQTLMVMVDLYLFASAILIGVTVQVLYFTDHPFGNLWLLLGLGVGWLGLGLWYISLIVVARLVLAAEIPRLGASPLAR